MCSAWCLRPLQIDRCVRDGAAGFLLVVDDDSGTEAFEAFDIAGEPRTGEHGDVGTGFADDGEGLRIDERIGEGQGDEAGLGELSAAAWAQNVVFRAVAAAAEALGPMPAQCGEDRFAHD